MFDAALPPATRDLLAGLNGELVRGGFYLAGGTGLALQLGHRVSEDLDFFTGRDFEPGQLAHTLEARAGYEETSISPGTLHCRIGAVRLSFLRYPVPLIWPTLSLLGTSIADWRDILAEKFKTLSRRGSRKDFTDIYACITLQGLAVGTAVSLFRRRFAGTGVNYYHVLKSLAWFDEADQEPELALLKPLDWPTVRRFFTDNLEPFEQHLLRLS